MFFTENGKVEIILISWQKWWKRLAFHQFNLPHEILPEYGIICV
ncbi:MAG: hypothetical protein NZ530_01020 [Thermodesulfobacteriaceae bacterium]|nr:hypothetical protein [Thermodesulfobacteriaceae bacterium]MCX8042005.1 hypothetical protein [Thermodesulfobacteriaceae bacterium]MDW8136431.1 hypothetical protein [Thermodesulfobacterium sp.]